MLRADAAHCHACPLWRRATQTVFGEGPGGATLMLVGEQPGDQEDRAGHPFVGPAGRLLEAALDEIGVERKRVYLTNAVKHFKWKPSPDRGKRRLHQKPSTAEVNACRPWLFAEIAAVGPEVIVCLGATAAQALLGPKFRVTKQRGELVLATLPGIGSPLRATGVISSATCKSLCRSPRTAGRLLGGRARRNRRRPKTGLPDQRGETLQMEPFPGSRQAPATSKAQHRRGQRMPSLAVRRDRGVCSPR